jgi:hypothetical protein
MTPASEEWRPVLGYEGAYEVSDHGGVRSLPRVVTRSDGRPRTIHGRVLKPVQVKRRRNVSLSMDGVVQPRHIAVLVLEAFIGPRPLGHHACHNDGDSLNDSLTNLRWDENNYDRVRHGQHQHANKTRCPWGHLLVEPNLVAATAVQGFRGCRACNTARSARRRACKEGSVYDMQYESDLIYSRIMLTA